MSDPVPKPYRVFFRLVDPTLSPFGLIMHLQSDRILPKYALGPSMPPATETRLPYMPWHRISARCYSQSKTKRDSGMVWNCLQATNLIELAMLAGFYRALSSTGRMDVSTWRIEEWNNIMINNFVAVIRTQSVLGVGLPKIKEA
ncbi:hypothetical protein AC578_256 [Pseudocercospora eumusae]|uniref:Uncharacterized protein n=1 Tax=Pseudocercospora eumusae TaxID=321146 RepID=A0A139HIP4_9PEZI|nr:hypothetical protein AC578_256 [Pseudocercospora eumusae]